MSTLIEQETALARSLLRIAEFSPAPIKTTWGEGMVVTDIGLDKDHTISVYAHKDDVAAVKASFVQKGDGRGR